MVEECIFCNIILRKIPADIVYEDGSTLAFLDIHPCSPGHTVVIPKAHREHLLSVEAGEAGLLFESVRTVMGILMKKINPQGFTIGINHGSIAGQEVSHLHVHIIPRYTEDGGGAIQSVIQNKKQQSLEEVKKNIFS